MSNSNETGAFERARQQLDHDKFAEWWSFNDDGLELVGEFIREKRVEFKDSLEHRVIELRLDHGEKRAVCIDRYQQLQEKLDAAEPDPGSIVAIARSRDMRESTKNPGQHYYVWTVSVVPADTPDPDEQVGTTQETLELERDQRDTELSEDDAARVQAPAGEDGGRDEFGY